MLIFLLLHCLYCWTCVIIARWKGTDSLSALSWTIATCTSDSIKPSMGAGAQGLRDNASALELVYNISVLQSTAKYLCPPSGMFSRYVWAGRNWLKCCMISVDFDMQIVKVISEMADYPNDNQSFSYAIVPSAGANALLAWDTGCTQPSSCIWESIAP